MANKIGIIEGDGIGPEVVREAIKVLKYAAELYKLELQFHNEPFSSQYLIDNRQLTYDQKSKLHVVFDDTEAEIAAEVGGLLGLYDAILFGAVGDPRVKPGDIERPVIGGLRWNADTPSFAGVRPALNLWPINIHGELQPGEIDFYIVRENTEGSYTRKGGKRYVGTPKEEAYREKFATLLGTERIHRFAFELARKLGREKVVSTHKSNAEPDVGGYWRSIAERIAKEYPDIAFQYLQRDVVAGAVGVAKSYRPAGNTDAERVKNIVFDVLVVDNDFGDSFSSAAAAAAWGDQGKAIAPSANINPGKGAYFEATHGSAP
ncbi:MAG: hypothetical protein HY519_02185, partial [Candidatus Aenigmarchaeota archaeon]|nr:hypothetical protein [Candidatus Aenigmarchaeota archaeon]